MGKSHWYDKWVDVLKWLWRRDSESAACLAIWLFNDMTVKDVLEMAKYGKFYGQVGGREE